MRIRLILALAGVAALSWEAAAADPMDDAVAQLKETAPYATARLPLFQAGWRAAPDPAFDGGERCAAREEICAAYPETDSCSGTGMGNCNFRFVRPDGRILKITTIGEPVTDLAVYRWELAKP